MYFSNPIEQIHAQRSNRSGLVLKNQRLVLLSDLMLQYFCDYVHFFKVVANFRYDFPIIHYESHRICSELADLQLTKNSLFNINSLYRLGMPFQSLQLWTWAPLLGTFQLSKCHLILQASKTPHVLQQTAFWRFVLTI